MYALILIGKFLMMLVLKIFGQVFKDGYLLYVRDKKFQGAKFLRF